MNLYGDVYADLRMRNGKRQLVFHFDEQRWPPAVSFNVEGARMLPKEVSGLECAVDAALFSLVWWTLPADMSWCTHTAGCREGARRAEEDGGAANHNRHVVQDPQLGGRLVRRQSRGCSGTPRIVDAVGKS